MSTILLSFEPEWFAELSSGRKKFEYRKYFPKGETTVFFYVSSPIKAITGIAKFGERQNLHEWLSKYGNRSQEVKNRINSFCTDCNYAIPMLSFQATNKIELSILKKDIPNFIVPRMYYYLDNSKLLEYLTNNLHATEPKIINSFEFIKDDDIC